MELRAYGIANSYHGEITISDRKPDGKPINSLLWKCSHEHVEFSEALACCDEMMRSKFDGEK